MSEPLDLDRLRAERAIRHDEPRSVILGGITFAIPSTLTLKLALAYERNSIRQLLEGLFGDQLDKVLEVEPPLDLEDLRAIVEALAGGRGNLGGSTT